MMASNVIDNSAYTNTLVLIKMFYFPNNFNISINYETIDIINPNLIQLNGPLITILICLTFYFCFVLLYMKFHDFYYN